MKLVLTMFAVVLCFGSLVPAPSAGQSVRSPQMNLEFHRAQAAWKSGGSLLEAKARLDRVIEADSEDVEAVLLRARVELAMKHNVDAVADARRAAELAPDNGDAQLVLCQAARVVGDTTLALQALERSVDAIAADPRKHILLSREAMLLGRIDTSESLARVAVALDEANPEAHYQLARALAAGGNRDGAVLILSRGLVDGLLSPDYIASDTVFASTGVAGTVLNR